MVAGSIHEESSPLWPSRTSAQHAVTGGAGGVEMTELLQLRLKQCMNADEIDALKSAMLNSSQERGRPCWSYAKNVEKAFDIHGLEGIRWQVAYMLLHLWWWKGAEARACKLVLRKFSWNKVA